MRTHQVEVLEERRLLAVITNDGAPGSPDYLSVDIGPGGSVAPGNTFFSNYGGPVLYQYGAVLDVATTAAGVVTHTMYDLTTAARPEFKVDDYTVQSSGRINVGTGAFIDFVATTTLQPGTFNIDTKYSFIATNYDLTQARLFQITHADGTVIGDEVLVVEGSIAGGNLSVSAVEPPTYIWWRQQNGLDNLNAALSGYAADTFGGLQTTIGAGGFVAPATGSINTTNLPAIYVPFIGSVWGTGDVNTATQYNFLSSSSGTVSTRLNLYAAQDVPLMRIYYGNTLINDGSVARSAVTGTDFGATPGSHTFDIRNQGGADMLLRSTPTITLSGPNADSFRVYRYPVNRVGAGLSSSFSIEYVPTQGGVQWADVTITSNDLSTSPYTFRVYGGNGSSIQPDIYEDDGPNTIDTASNWASQFAIAKTKARTIATSGATQIHSIHANADVDWMTFQLTSAQDVVIETFAPIGDTRIYLYDSSGTRLGLNLDSGPGVSARLATRLAAGTYYVRVDEQGNNAQIPLYTVSVRTGNPVPAAQTNVDAAGKLLVWGTGFGDTIGVDLVQNSVRVVVNSNIYYYPLLDVQSVEIRSGWGDDTVYIGAGVAATAVFTGLGNDTVTSQTLADTDIQTGVGDDRVNTGSGNDHVNTKDGNDTIYGGGGNDLLQGGANDDEIHGDAGNDTLMGNYGNDTLIGGEGDDVLTGDWGDDSLNGNAGNDGLNGGSGEDVLDSGVGYDAIASDDGEIDVILRNPNQDVVFADENDILEDQFESDVLA